MTEVAHACTTLVEVDAGKAFAFLADPKALGGWALGCWDAKVDGAGCFHGRSLFSGEKTWGRLDADPARLLVDYLIGSREAAPFTISAATFDRTRHPARGRDGGRPGAVGAARLSNGEELLGKGVHVVPVGARLIIKTPGGGGLGDPREREREALRRDLEAGRVSRAGAASDYGLDV